MTELLKRLADVDLDDIESVEAAIELCTILQRHLASGQKLAPLMRELLDVLARFQETLQ